jgi:CHAT domain-containing protein
MRKASVCTTLMTFCALSAGHVAVSGREGQADVMTLDPDRRIEHHLAGSEQHRYHVALTAGELVHVVVEQEGIDVVVRVGDPSGNPVADFQDEIRPRGDEQVDVVAEKEGTYTLTIEPARRAVEGDYAIRVNARRAATDADRAMQESRKLRTAATGLESSGKIDEARPLFEGALRIAEDAQGPDGLFVTFLVVDLAGNALELHDDARAESLYERALVVLDKALGPEDPQSAMVRSRLGLVYQRKDQRSRAEGLVRQALVTIARSLGPEHPWYVRCLLTLANLRDDAGDLQKAEEISRRALDILDGTHETDTILYASLLNTLADVERQKNDFAGADDLYRRSLAIGETLRGPDSYFVSTALQNLGIVARERKDYPEALADYTRALTIRERIVGPDHPDVAQLLNNVANIYHATGDDAKSLETHFHALRIWERTVGPYQRGTLLSVGNIARTYASIGDIAKAVEFQRRADAILETQLTLNLATGSEREKLAFARSTSVRTDRTISLHLHEAPDNPDASALAALVLLQRKGRVLDAMTDAIATVRQHVGNSGDRTLLDRLSETTGQLARLALSAPKQTEPEERQQWIELLETRKEQLEATLSEHSAEFRAQSQPITVEAVQGALPNEAALLEFAVFHPFDPTAEQNGEAYGAAHYAAYVIRKHSAPTGVDLGAAATIDRLIDTLRDALRNPQSIGFKPRARAVDERVMRPLRAAIGDATRLLVSPDGNLNVVPFEALVDEHGRYLIERYGISYLTSGRDLLRMQVARASRSEPIILADPLFGEPTDGEHLARTRAATRAQQRSVTSGATLGTLYFAPLSGSAAEARAIKALFPEATLLTGRRATKAILQQVTAPRILHIASHGFFLEQYDEGPAAADGNPLLRSGLAFAGANLTHDGPGNGILTALEASALDLWGTKLVTLSACDTGIGEVRNGEGVYGLRRAFVLAGAETLVMSLWPVSDYIARDAMVAYYAGLRSGLGRGDALRQAKLAMLKRPNRRHPNYWAGFIQSGEWADLDGNR